MKIELIKQTFKDEDGYSQIGYKYKPFEFCCERMEHNPLVKLSSVDSDDWCYRYECDEEDCINCNAAKNHPCMTLEEVVEIRSYEDEWTEAHNYPIDYCPFCGESIEVSIVKEEDVTEAYHNLEKERKEMYNKRNKTDSIKKRQELEKIVRKLDNELNSFYNLEEYKE